MTKNGIWPIFIGFIVCYGIMIELYEDNII